MASRAWAARGVLEEEVERGDPALGVEVAYHDPVSLDPHTPRRLAPQLLQQCRREAVLQEGQVLELLRVGQAAHPVVDEDQVVLGHHLFVGDGLRGAEVVADDLEDHVEGGQGEDHHDQPRLPFGDLEAGLGVLELAQERVEEERLAVLVPADRGVQLLDGLERHQLGEKRDQRRGADRLDVEIAPGEGEDDAGLLRRGEDRVQADALGRMDQRHDEGHAVVARDQPADQVRPLVAVEGSRHQLEGLDRGAGRQLLEVAGQRGGGACRVSLEVGKGTGDGKSAEHLAQQAGHSPRADHVGADGLAGGRRLDPGEVVRQELHPRPHTHCPQDPPGHAVVEGEGQLGVVAPEGQRHIGVPGVAPEGAVAWAAAQLAVQLSDHPVGELRVEAQPLVRVPLRPQPVAAHEPGLRPPGDQLELGLVRLEPGVHQAGEGQGGGSRGHYIGNMVLKRNKHRGTEGSLRYCCTFSVVCVHLQPMSCCS